MKAKISLSPLQKIGIGAARALLPRGAREISEHLANHALWQGTPRFPAFPSIKSGARLLILSPHPDDEVLGCAGLVQTALQAGAQVHIAFLTCGDGSRTTQIALNLKNPFRGDKTLFQIAQSRQLEALEAANTLGVDAQNVHFLGFPDGVCWKLWNSPGAILQSPTTGFDAVPYQNALRPGAPYSREGLLEVLGELLEKTAPTQVFTTHHADTHLDHKAAFAFLQEALRQSQSRAKFWEFVIHYGIWPVPNGLHPQTRLAPPAPLWKSEAWHELELDAPQIEVKLLALGCHRTQMASTPRYLSAFVRQNELFCPVSQ